MYSFEDRPDVPNPRGKILTFEEMDTARRCSAEKNNSRLGTKTYVFISQLRKVLNRLVQLGEIGLDQTSVERVKEYQREIQALRLWQRSLSVWVVVSLRPWLKQPRPLFALTSNTECKTLPGNVRLYYVGPMFRRERPPEGPLSAVLSDRRGSYLAPPTRRGLMLNSLKCS